MSYHILEEPIIDKDGNYIPPSKFFVVNSNGKRIAGPFSDFLSANYKLQELKRLAVEKTFPSGTNIGR